MTITEDLTTHGGVGHSSTAQEAIQKRLEEELAHKRELVNPNPHTLHTTSHTHTHTHTYTHTHTLGGTVPTTCPGVAGTGG